MKSILLVEDDLLNQTVIEDIFEFDDVPAQLICADSGEEAIIKAVEHLPALILMDVRLPGIDGLEATRRIKADPKTAEIPVWALTANAMKGDQEQALNAGCCDYITKPIHVKELTVRVKEFLKEISESVTS